jgi:hypothetical protein
VGAVHGRARYACNSDDPATAFTILCKKFEEILATRNESVAIDALRGLPIVEAGVAVVRSETGLKLKPLPVTCIRARKQCELLAEYVSRLVDRLPCLTLAERMEVLVSRMLQGCMTGKSKLRCKRKLLWVLAGIRLEFLQQQARSAALLTKQQLLLACLLHEPESRIRSLWHEHIFWFHFNYARRLIHLENGPESVSYLSSFIWPDKADYQRAIYNSAASRVLVSIHMGDFFGAFRALAALSDPGRQAISLRRDETPNHGMQNFSANRVTHQVLYRHQHQPAAIVSALRQGHHTLATLFDLRDDFGSTVVVNFFGQRARFVKGPAQLAILGRSPIFAFVCFERQGQNCIEMAPVIDTQVRPGETLQQATVRITQVLVALAENWITRWPAQWKYLGHLPAYFEVAS